MDTGHLTAAGLTYETAYRLLVDRSPVPVWIAYQGDIVYINSAGLKLLGAEHPDQVLGRPPFQFIHPRYHHHVHDRMYRVRSGQEEDVGISEEEFIRLDGTLVPVSVSAAVFPYGDGNAVQVHFTDISALRRSEQDLVAGEQRFRTVVENVTDYAIFSIGADGIVLSWNAGAERIKGYTDSEIVGQPYEMFYTPEDRAAGRPGETLRLAAETGNYSGEGWRVRKDGTRFWASVSIAAVRDSDGSLRAFTKVTRDLTAGHDAEEKLRESEERFRSTFEQAAVGIAHVGMDGAWLRVNERLCEMVGYAKEELLARTFLDITHPEDIRADWEQAQALARGDISTYSMEKRYICKSQSILWINLTVSLVRESSGELQYFIAVIEDISARKHAELELRASEDRFRTLFEVSPVANYLIDPQNQLVVAANERAATQIGYNHGELTGMPVVQFDARLTDAEIRMVAAASVAGTPLAFETRHRTKSGELRDVFVTSECVQLGGRTLLFASALDITERKIIEQQVRDLASTLEQRVVDRTRELNEQRLFLQAVLDNIDVGIVSCGSEGALTLFNRASMEWHGLPVCAVPAERWAEHYSLYETDGRTPLSVERMPLVQALRGGVVRDVEMMIAPPGRPPRHIRSTGQLLVDDHGKRLGAVVAMHDVTRQVRAEDERTRAMLRLQEANQELEAFAYTVSHDLRAPLRSIEGFGRILLRDHEHALDDSAVGHLRRISAATQRMGQLIDDLLMLSRISRQELRRSDVDLSALSESIIRELKNRHPERRVHVIIHPGLVAHADARLTRVMLENLLTNAWKFTGKTETPRIEITCRAAGERPLVFKICDNGAGFDMAYGDQLFRPFQRLHQATEFEGTGIGLATVRRIVGRHGGVIWAEAAPGRGATFFFTLTDGKIDND